MRRFFLAILVVICAAAAVFFYAGNFYGDEPTAPWPQAQPGMTAAEVESIRFPESAWGRKYVAFRNLRSAVLPENFDFGISPPPGNASPETRAELDLLLKMQAEERTKEEIEKIIFEHHVSSSAEIFAANGNFDPKTQPKTDDLLRIIEWDITQAVLDEKDKYDRPRPVQLEPRLTTVIPTPPHPAYPSGHAGQGYGPAIVLGMLDPAHKAEHAKLGWDIGRRREIAGVHYPSDSAAGRKIAEVAVQEMMKDKKIADLFAQAQKEWPTPQISNENSKTSEEE